MSIRPDKDSAIKFKAIAYVDVHMYVVRILVWEDGFCNFAASMTGSGNHMDSAFYTKTEPQPKGLQPELFFKMSHEIYNYGEGYAKLQFVN